MAARIAEIEDADSWVTDKFLPVLDHPARKHQISLVLS